MNKFRPSSKRNPCSVCDNETGKCRDNGDVILCMPLGDTRVGELVGEYRCIGNRGAGWATFKIDNSTEWNEQRQGEWEEKKQDREKAREAEEADRRRRSLTEEERDKGYRAVLSQLDLHPDDRADLIKRGFSLEDIERHGFKSVVANQPLEFSPASPALPGVKFDGWHLVTGGAGYLCPIINEKGLIIGMQLRLLKPPDGNRYRWLSSQQAVLALPNGENPIGIYYPKSGKPEGICLVDSVGTKPRLTAELMNCAVIGAAGGQFCQSPEQLKKYLGLVETESKIVRIFPDAGDIQNRNVIWRFRGIKELLIELGYKPRFGWWNQITKEDSDIDEGVDPSQIEYLNWHNFKTLADKYCQEYSRLDCPKIISNSNQNKSDNSAAQNKSENSAAKLIPLKSEGRKEKKPEKIRFPDKINPKHWKAWLETRIFTPDILQELEFVEFDAPAPGTILAVKSGLGSGKTYQLEKLFKEGGAFADDGAIALFSRNSLAYNFVGRMGGCFSHVHEELSILRGDPQSKLALCTNSLKKFSNLGWFDDKVLIVDEFASVSAHIVCSATHRKDRIESLNLWKEIFTRSKCVIILDGNLTDWQVEWAHKQAPAKKVVKMENTFKKEKPLVEILLGTPTKSGKFDDRKISPFVAPMVASDVPIIVFTDSQKLGEQIEKLLLDVGKKGLRIDSKTVPKKDSQEKVFLRDCNEWIKRHKPDYIICSPTAESGVDINVPGYFRHSYGLFRGIVATDTQMQMMARYRDPQCQWHISVPKASFLRGKDRDFYPGNLQEMINKYIEFCLMDLSKLRLEKGWITEQFLQFIEQAKSDPNQEFAFQQISKEAFEKQNLRECLIYALENAGHEVNQTVKFANEQTEEALKNAGEEVKQQTAKEIFEAEDISEKEVEDLAASWAATWEDRCKVLKASYKKLMPGIEETEFWTQDFIYYLKYKNPKAIAQAELFYFFKNDAVTAKKRQLNSWAKIATQQTIFMPDLNSSHLRVKALKKLNLEQFLDPEKAWTKDSPEILKLLDLGQGKRIQNALGIKPGKNNQGKLDGIDYLSKILELVGLKLAKPKWLPRNEEGKQIRSYSVSREALEDPVRVAIEAAVTRRYQQFDEQWVMPEILSISNQQEIKVEPEIKINIEVNPTIEVDPSIEANPGSISVEPNIEINIAVNPNIEVNPEIETNPANPTKQTESQGEEKILPGTELDLMQQDIEQCVEWIRDAIAKKDPEFARDINLTLSITAKEYPDAFRKGVWGRLSDEERNIWKNLVGAAQWCRQTMQNLLQDGGYGYT